MSFCLESTQSIEPGLGGLSAFPVSIYSQSPKTLEKITRVLGRSRTNGALGCDGVTDAMLRHAQTSLPDALCKLFNKVMVERAVLVAWKHAKVIALPKW